MTLIKRYILFTFLITIGTGTLITPMLVYLSYHKETADASERVRQVGDSHLPFLISSLWMTHYELLQQQLNLVVQYPYIDRVEVTDTDGRLFYSEMTGGGDSTTSVLEKHETDMHYNRRGTNLKIGEMTLFLNTHAIRQDTLTHELNRYGFYFISAVILAAAVALMFYHTTGRHLKRLSDFLKTSDYSNLATPLAFDGKRNYNDEIDELAVTINTLRRGLYKHIKEKDILIREVHHRIKNHVASIQNLLIIQAETVSNPEAAKILRQAESRLGSMKVLYDKLYREGTIEALPVKEYFPPLLEEIIQVFPESGVTAIDTDFDNVVLGASNLSALGIMLNELVTNSVKYAFTPGVQGSISFRIKKTGSGTMVIDYSDNGKGLPDAVIRGEKSGLGMVLIRSMAEQLGAELTIGAGKGANVRLILKAPPE